MRAEQADLFTDADAGAEAVLPLAEGACVLRAFALPRAPGLLEAVPVLQSYAVAAAIVLVVWALWPATRYRGRGHRTEAASG